MMIDHLQVVVIIKLSYAYWENRTRHWREKERRNGVCLYLQQVQAYATKRVFSFLFF